MTWTKEEIELIRKPSPKRWTKEEIELLKKVYPEEGGEAIKHFPGRTLHAMRAKAQQLGIPAKNIKPVYTEENFEEMMKPHGWKPLDEYGGSNYRIHFMCLKCNDYVIESCPRNVIHGTIKCDNCRKIARGRVYTDWLLENRPEYELVNPFTTVMGLTMHRHIPCGTEWRVKPHDIKHGSNCPVCSHMLSNKVYCLYFPELELYKIGISNNVKSRQKFYGHKSDVVWVEEYPSYLEAKERERELLSKVELENTGELRSGNRETFRRVKENFPVSFEKVDDI